MTWVAQDSLGFGSCLTWAEAQCRWSLWVCRYPRLCRGHIVNPSWRQWTLRVGWCRRRRFPPAAGSEAGPGPPQCGSADGRGRAAGETEESGWREIRNWKAWWEETAAGNFPRPPKNLKSIKSQRLWLKASPHLFDLSQQLDGVCISRWIAL